jgi:hypothetical protein
MASGGVQVFVRGGRLMVRLLTPVPVLYRTSCCTPTTSRTRMCSGSTCRSSEWERPASCSAANPGSLRQPSIQILDHCRLQRALEIDHPVVAA